MVAGERAHDAANRTRLSGERLLPCLEPGQQSSLCLSSRLRLSGICRPFQRPNWKTICQCVQRNAPFGSEPWVLRTAATLGLQSSLGRRGNPHLERRATDGR